ncbi:hypothetical protein QQ045_017763 [Rhodiola kirilowii]
MNKYSYMPWSCKEHEPVRRRQISLHVGSFDAGYGSSIMLRLVGPKKAREMWFLARFYSAAEAERMGLVNAVVPV